jgi:hypothetical protein
MRNHERPTAKPSVKGHLLVGAWHEWCCPLNIYRRFATRRIMESSLGFRSPSLTSPQAIKFRRFATKPLFGAAMRRHGIATGKMAAATATRGTVLPATSLASRASIDGELMQWKEAFFGCCRIWYLKFATGFPYVRLFGSRHYVQTAG